METDTYLIWLIVALLALALLGALKVIKRKKRASSQNAFLKSTFQKAYEQQATIDLKLSQDTSRAGLTTRISSLQPGSIQLKCSTPVSDAWHNSPIEGFFQIEQEGTPVFFVFESTIRNIKPDDSGVILDIPEPNYLRVEKKRHFPRVRPDASSILMIALWPVSPGKRLPRKNAELGHPAMSWKTGQKDTNIKIENISASGIALGLSGDVPIDTTKGRQIAGVIVYRQDAQPDKIVFLFTGEVMNIRKEEQTTAIGLEFTNWAVQKTGESEIHWSHSSPWRGVKPVHQWVEQIKRSN